MKNNLSIQHYNDDESIARALERGERFLSRGFVQGFGVHLPSGKRQHAFDVPESREEAERVRAALSMMLPDAEVVRMGLDSNAVTETQDHAPDDLYIIHFIFESEPGVWSRQTNLDFSPLEVAMREADRLKAAGCLAVQLERERSYQRANVA